MYMYEAEENYNNFKQINNYLYAGHIDKMGEIFKENAYNSDFEDNFMNCLEKRKFQFNLSLNKSDSRYSAISKQCALLSHLNLEHQLHILDNYIFPNVRMQHIQLLLQNHDAHTIMQTHAFDICVAYYFHKEDFDVIDQLDELCGTNVLILDKKDGCIYTDCQSAGGAIALLKTVKFHFPIFYPYHDVIYAYTPEKEAYLLSKGIILPEIDDAKYITEKILVNLDVYEDLDDHDKIYFNNGIEYYSKLKTYKDLQTQLPHNDKKVERPKI